VRDGLLIIGTLSLTLEVLLGGACIFSKRAYFCAVKVPNNEMSIAKLYDRIVLASDLPDSRFKAGDVGTIVEIYGDGETYEVEFFALEGSTLAVKTVPGGLVKPVSSSMMLHSRELAA